jgi:tetratricopeptide (TPR) repeat protein
VFAATLKLILEADARAPAPTQPARLRALFARLRAAPDVRTASAIEELIWGHWMEHTELAATEALASATQAIAERRYAVADARLDDLTARYPDFAEAWNKRATLHFLRNRDEASVADIHRALELEPRHFGAICGFGQICLRQGRRQDALFAFDAALRVNPHLGAVRRAYDELLAEAPAQKH